MNKIIPFILLVVFSTVFGESTDFELRPVSRELEFKGEYFPASETDTPPIPVRFVVAEYPKRLKENQIEAVVKVHFIVNKRGIPEQIQVKDAVDVEFANSAIKCVSMWLFKPAEKNGKKVGTRIMVPVKFNLPKPEDANKTSP